MKNLLKLSSQIFLLCVFIGCSKQFQSPFKMFDLLALKIGKQDATTKQDAIAITATLINEIKKIDGLSVNKNLFPSDVIAPSFPNNPYTIDEIDGITIRYLSGTRVNNNSTGSLSYKVTLSKNGSSDRTVTVLYTSFLSYSRKSWTARTLSGHSSWVNSVSFSPDGGKIVSGSRDNTIKLWRVSDGSLLRTLRGHNDFLESVSFSPDGGKIVSGSYDNTIKLWRVSDGSLLNTLRGDIDYPRSILFSPDGSTIVSAVVFDHKVKLWRVSDSSLLKTLSGHSSWVWSVSFSPDGGTIVSGSSDKTIKLWRVSDGSLLKTLRDQKKVYSVSFSPDGGTIVSGGDDNTIKLWRVSDGSLLRTLSGHDKEIVSVSFSPWRYNCFRFCR